MTKKCPNLLTPLEPLVTHISAEGLKIEIPSLTTIEKWMSLIFVNVIHSK